MERVDTCCNPPRVIHARGVPSQVYVQSRQGQARNHTKSALRRMPGLLSVLVLTQLVACTADQHTPDPDYAATRYKEILEITDERSRIAEEMALFLGVGVPTAPASVAELGKRLNDVWILPVLLEISFFDGITAHDLDTLSEAGPVLEVMDVTLQALESQGLLNTMTIPSVSNWDASPGEVVIHFARQNLLHHKIAVRMGIPDPGGMQQVFERFADPESPCVHRVSVLVNGLTAARLAEPLAGRRVHVGERSLISDLFAVIDWLFIRVRKTLPPLPAGLNGLGATTVGVVPT